jgi:hypothetical protein
MRLEAGGAALSRLSTSSLALSSLDLSAGSGLKLSGLTGGPRNAFAKALKRRLRHPEAAPRSGIMDQAYGIMRATFL